MSKIEPKSTYFQYIKKNQYLCIKQKQNESMRKPKRPKIKLTKQKKTKILSTSCVCCVVYPHPHIFVEFSVNSILWTFFLFIFSSHSFASFNRFLCQTIFCAKARFFFWKMKKWQKLKENQKKSYIYVRWHVNISVKTQFFLLSAGLIEMRQWNLCLFTKLNRFA